MVSSLYILDHFIHRIFIVDCGYETCLIGTGSRGFSTGRNELISPLDTSRIQ
jgi:hypothetical protein